MMKNDKTIEEISNEDSDFETVTSGRPEQGCNDREIINNCKDPVTLNSVDNEHVNSDNQASSSESKDENVAGPSQFDMNKINTSCPKIHFTYSSTKYCKAKTWFDWFSCILK